MPLCAKTKVALYLNVFLSCVSFAIVLPSLWPYLDQLGSTKSFLAYVVAIYSIGEALGAILFGSLTRYVSTRATLVSATLTGLAGSFLYVLAALFPNGGFVVLIARFLQGCWTGGCQAAQQSFLADVLPVDYVTTTTVELNAYACMGFVAGPAFGLFCNLFPEFRLFSALSVDQLTAPGYFVLLSGLIGVALLISVFDEERDRGYGIIAHDAGDSAENVPLLGKNYQKVAFNTPLGAALMICNMAFFTHFYGFALQETVTTPLVQEFYGWTVFTANLLFTFAGVCALLAFVLVGITTRYLTDRLLTLISLALGTIGYLLLLCTPESPLPVARFLLGFAIISVAFPMGRAVVISLYTKLLPMHVQGTGQGIILAVGALARVLGPFWAVRAFYMTWGPAIVFGVTASVFAACMALVALYYRTLDVGH